MYMSAPQQWALLCRTSGAGKSNIMCNGHKKTKAVGNVYNVSNSKFVNRQELENSTFNLDVLNNVPTGRFQISNDVQIP